MTATSFFTICKYINTSLNSRIKGFKVIHCVVTETIDTALGEGGPKNAISEGVGRGGFRVRLLSYQKLTAALLSKFSVI